MNALHIAIDAWRTKRGGAPAIAARQAERLDALVSHARRASPFYAQHFRVVPDGPVRLGDLTTLPPVDKPTLMAHFDDWVTDPRVTRTRVSEFVAQSDNIGKNFLGEYLVFTTSGSTAEPALLIEDRRAIAVMFGLTYARSAGVLPPQMIIRILARGARQAALFATGGHFLAATMFERRIRTQPLRRKYSRLFSVLDPLPELVAKLNEFQPVLLGTYASMLSLLVEEQESGRLRISPLVITTGGELLSSSVKSRAEQVFGCLVTESYNASEVTPLSMPCSLGRLHLNTDWFLIEAIDAAGEPVPNGQRSESVLVTNLANYVQPLIRYELGDSIVIAAEPCPCGSPFPTVTPEGRTDDILKVPAAQGGDISLPPMAIATVVEETPGVLQYQVVQSAPASLIIRLRVYPTADRTEVWQRVKQRIDAFLRTQGATAVGVSLAGQLPQANPRSGKLRHVVKALPTTPT